MVRIVLKTGKELELTLEEMQELLGSSVPMVVPYTYPVPMPVYPTYPNHYPFWYTTSGSAGTLLNNCTTGTTNAP